ncbi:hypothetical protein ACH4NF_10835 [Streptomyces sp. NPDC017248]|uniref:hypothetical protein n=1 Tax=unclassified Streptomyces TaxID=2593676 RepID=UPI0037981307
MWVTAEGVTVLPVDPLETFVQSADLGRQVGDDLRGGLLAGGSGLPGLSGFQCGRRHRVCAPQTLRAASQAVSRARPRRRIEGLTSLVRAYAGYVAELTGLMRQRGIEPPAPPPRVEEYDRRGV